MRVCRVLFLVSEKPVDESNPTFRVVGLGSLVVRLFVHIKLHLLFALSLVTLNNRFDLLLASLQSFLEIK